RVSSVPGRHAPRDRDSSPRMGGGDAAVAGDDGQAKEAGRSDDEGGRSAGNASDGARRSADLPVSRFIGGHQVQNRNDAATSAELPTMVASGRTVYCRYDGNGRRWGSGGPLQRSLRRRAKSLSDKCPQRSQDKY